MRNNQLMNTLERKYGRYAIDNLMKIIVVGMGLVYAVDLISAPMNQGVGTLSQFFAFSRPLILRGQIWRLITFIFVPPASSPLFILITLYFYWLIGQYLEQYWGAFRFNVYYLCGMLGAIIAGFITGYSTNYYLNLSLFLAFATFQPDLEVLLFFILPVKIKWLALVALASLTYMLFTSPWSGKLALVMSLINLIIFFGPDLVQEIKQLRRRYEWKKNTRQ